MPIDIDGIIAQLQTIKGSAALSEDEREYVERLIERRQQRQIITAREWHTVEQFLREWKGRGDLVTKPRPQPEPPKQSFRGAGKQHRVLQLQGTRQLGPEDQGPIAKSTPRGNTK